MTDATPKNVLLGQLIVGAVIVVFAKLTGVEFTTEETVALQGGFGGLLALVLPNGRGEPAA